MRGAAVRDAEVVISSNESSVARSLILADCHGDFDLHSAVSLSLLAALFFVRTASRGQQQSDALMNPPVRYSRYEIALYSRRGAQFVKFTLIARAIPMKINARDSAYDA